MALVNYIQEYYSKIEDGTIKACEKTRKIYGILLQKIDQKEVFFDSKKAQKAIKFIELFVHHSKGRTDNLKLELWQKALCSALFGVVDADGDRQFREAFIVVARKNGKTTFLAGIAEYMSFADGEYGAEIYFMAPTLKLTAQCYGSFYQSIIQEPDLAKMIKKRRSDVYIEKTNTTAIPLPFGSDKNGFNPHLVICDEVAAWPAGPGIDRYQTMTSALGARRQPLVLSISTAGSVRNGVYDDLYERAEDIFSGKAELSTYLPIIYEVEDEAKWNDIDELRKSNPNLGVSVREKNLLIDVETATKSNTKLHEFKIKQCNIIQNSDIAWLKSKDIKMAMGEHFDLEDFRGCYAVGGYDLSMTTDLTAACLIVEKEGKLHCLVKFFLPSEKIQEAIARDRIDYYRFVESGDLILSEGPMVDYRDCVKWYVSAVEDYDIHPLIIGYDKWNSNYLNKEMENCGFELDSVRQGPNLTPVLREFEGLIMNGEIAIGDNKLLMMHFYNAAVKASTEGRIQLIKTSPENHIDGMAAVIDAMCVRQKWYDTYGHYLQNT